MNVELERIWKEAVRASSRYCRDICRERLSKTIEHLNENNLYPGRVSNRAYSEY
jgi:hypothetical protein